MKAVNRWAALVVLVGALSACHSTTDTGSDYDPGQVALVAAMSGNTPDVEVANMKTMAAAYKFTPQQAMWERCKHVRFAPLHEPASSFSCDQMRPH